MCRWKNLRRAFAALKPCRASIVLVLAALVFLLVPQGQDVMRVLAERKSAHQDDWERFFFFSGVLVWTVSAWYWARVMLRLELPGVPPGARGLQRLRTWAPRLIGTAAPLGVAASLYLASRGYDTSESNDVADLLRQYAGWCAAGAAAFFLAVSSRRRLARVTRERIAPRAARLAALLDVSKPEEEVYGEAKFLELGGVTLTALGAAVAAALALFVLFTFFVQSSAPLFGTSGVLLYAAAGWIAAASVVDFVGIRRRFPAFLALFALAAIFSLWNDNHEVRTLAEPQPQGRPDVREALAAWLERQPKDAKTLPMFLVDAEGGGIRAAYWTAMVLGHIQDENPCFADRLFSLSGVSGGSLGSSVFVALLAERSPAGDCRHAPTTAIMETSRKILGEDFLAPVSAALLYPDLLQRFLPVPVHAFDRAVALEQSWERAFAKHAGSDRFARPFDSLWADKTRWTPALFLNATWVETGKRLIASNLQLAPKDGLEVFVDAEDAQAFFAPRSLPLSTAAHMSARFTYVSPAGTLVKDGAVRGRVVDGGYFENSGATATFEVLEMLPFMAEKDPRWKKVEPWVIHLSNEPVNPNAPPDSLLERRNRSAIRPQPWLNEVLSPPLALLNTRDGRGVYARDTLAWHVAWDHFLQFGLCRSSENIPLGWVLSQATQDRMKAQLTGDKCASKRHPGEVIFDNPSNLEKIRGILG
jgi:hypothetical protein